MSGRIDLNDVRLLLQVVEHGSYTAASRAIGIPKSTISQRIAQLEAAVGTGLLRRTSRSLSLTDAGAALLPHARAIEGLARDVERSLDDNGPELRGTLRVSCSHAIANFAVLPVVPRFLELHGRVTVKVEATNRLVDIIGEGYDMTVRGHVGPLKDSALVQRVIARTPWVLAASPAWIAEHGAPATVGELPGKRTLCFSHTPNAQVWLLVRNGEEHRVEVAAQIISDDMLSLRESAIAGGGVTCLPGYLLRSALDSGELELILPGWTSQTSTISVLTPPRAQSSRLAAAFSAFLAKEVPRLMRFQD